MGIIDHSIVTLRIFVDDLIPEKITKLLGSTPTESCIKNQEIIGKATGNIRRAETGSWKIRANPRKPENIESQIFEIIDSLTNDLSIWSSLSSKYKIDLFCGVFLKTSNDGLILSAKALLSLGQRGITLGLDIYDASND